MITFSVVIPLYNKVEHIKRSIDSVLEQSYSDFEIVVVNDGSTDGSGELVKKYNDKRIKLIEQDNAGVSIARNTGISNSNGLYIAFLDADDFWYPDFLDTIKNLIEKYPKAGAYATAYKVKEKDGKYYNLNFSPLPPYPWEGIIQNYFSCLASGNHSVRTSAICIKRKIFDEIGFFDPCFKIGEDTDMWIRAFLKNKIAFSTKIQAIYYEDTINKFDVNKYEFADDLQRLIDRLLCKEYLEKIPLKYQKLYIKSVGNKIFDLIKRFVYLGDKKAALRCYCEKHKYINFSNKFIALIMIFSPKVIVDPTRKIYWRIFR